MKASIVPYLFKVGVGSCLTLSLLVVQAVYAGVNLNPVDERITDQAISADLTTYERTQARVAALNERGIAVADYHLSKAQCWLDVSLHEYTRNDRSPFPQEALTQAGQILTALESEQQPDGATPLVNDADYLRDDLWTNVNRLKEAAGFSCYAQQVACAEVELVHAGNEHKQQGWRHAKPYIQIAEDLLAAAEATGDSCLPPPAVSTPAPVVAAAPVIEQERLELAADALFGFDKAGIDDLLAAGRAQLDALVSRLDEVYARIDRITLVGYTDRLGSAQYNQRLSERRAETVKQYLQKHGVSGPIDASGRGAADQIAQCGTSTRASKELIDCLQPNRRVTIEITGIKK